MSPEDLRSGLESLPRELYDEIYNLTFTAEPGVRDLGAVRSQKGNKSGSKCVYYRVHPATPFSGADNRSLLQVDRRSRAKYAVSYYGGEHTFFLARNRAAVSSWYASLEPAHCDLVENVHIVSVRPKDDQSLEAPKVHYFMIPYAGGYRGVSSGIWSATVSMLERLGFDAGEDWVYRKEDPSSIMRWSEYIVGIPRRHKGL